MTAARNEVNSRKTLAALRRLEEHFKIFPSLLDDPEVLAREIIEKTNDASDAESLLEELARMIAVYDEKLEDEDLEYALGVIIERATAKKNAKKKKKPRKRE